MLPDFIVIGFQKCGTTTLDRYLRNHPQIGMSRFKEPTFFSPPLPKPIGVVSNWEMGLEWYESIFEDRKGVLVRGEVTPRYSHMGCSEISARRIHATVPNAKLVILIRNPLERIRSAYLQNLYMRRHDRRVTLEEVLSVHDRPNDPLFPLYKDIEETSFYFRRLEPYFRLWRKESFHLLTLEELSSAREKTMRSLYRFLGIDENQGVPGVDEKLNASTNRMITVRDLTGWMNRFSLYREVKKKVPQNIIDFYRRFSRWTAPSGHVRMSEESKERLKKPFFEDCRKLQEFFGTKLPFMCALEEKNMNSPACPGEIRFDG